MVSVKKLSIISLIINVIFLSLSFALNPGITGFAVLEDVFNEYAFDIFSLIFIIGIVISLLGVYYGVKIENDIAEELSMFNIGEPNISIKGLALYLRSSAMGMYRISLTD